MVEFAAKIYKTDDYSVFKLMEENREIDGARIKKIKKSIKNIGYVIGAPIIVNENMEIIDGQCRYAVCEELGIPIYFTIQKNFGIEECISMNISATSWKSIDYIKSYAARGLAEYQYLLAKIEQYPQIKQPVIIAICADISDSNNQTIQNGTYKIDMNKLADAEETLEFINEAIPLLKKWGNATARMSLALAFAYRHSSADNERLKKCVGDIVLTAQVEQIGASTMQHALKMIENSYNNHLPAKNRIRLCIEYEDYLTGKFDWYEKKWGKKRNEVGKC